MNPDTIWLQVPSAQQKNPEQLESSSTDKLYNIAHTLSVLQNTSSPNTSNVSILLFFSKNNAFLRNDIFNPFSEIHNRCHRIEKKFKLKVELIKLSNAKPSNTIPRLTNAYIHMGDSTSKNPEINDEYMAKAINVGRQSAQRIKLQGAHLFVARDIDCKNNILLTALSFALMNIPHANFKKIDNKNHQRIHEMLEQNKDKLNSPLDILYCLGNLEIAALTGSYLCCAHMGLPVLVDGLICSIAALITTKLCPDAERWFIYSHAPHNSLQSIIFKHLKAKPLQETEIELNDLAGIISSISLLKLACTQYNENKTF